MEVSKMYCVYSNPRGRKGNMRESLKPGTEISFEGRNGKSFIIESLLSEEGASSLVYIAYSCDMLGERHFSVLKQLYPMGLDIKLHGDKASILVPEKSREIFDLYRDKFKAAYLKQVEAQSIKEAGNRPSDARGIYEGYNTLFIEMQYDKGYCYNSAKGESLYDILKTARAIAETVKLMYHDEKLLHLDLKPANIFILKETKDFIKVFDYDSVIPKEDAALGRARLSFSERWAAPELLLGKHREISYTADLYSIGAIVFHQIFGRTPSSRDLRHDSRFDFTKNKLFEGVSPSIYRPLTSFFHKTLQATPRSRYQRAEDLIEALNKLIPSASPINIHLKNHTFSSSPKFIGRDLELQSVGEMLNRDGYCFIHGMGGIGKTELAKQFANGNRGLYHTIHAIKYSGDLKKDILDMDFVNLDPRAFANEKGEIDFEGLYRFKRDKIQEQGEGTLIIIDNFNTDNDPALMDIISKSRGHHTLFTTKNEVFQRDEHYVKVRELSPEGSLELFYYFYRNSSEEAIIKRIIDQVGGNTLAVKLVASTMQRTNISPGEMLSKLQSGAGYDIAVRIKHSRDILEQAIDDETLLNHLCIVFDTAKLTEQQRYILMNMWFVSQHDITQGAFLALLGIDYTNELINTFNTLLEQNWINLDLETKAVSLHPVVAAVIDVQLQPCPSKCAKLVKGIVKSLLDSSYELLSPRQKISLGEEIVKQNQIPVHLYSQIYYGLSLQYNNEGRNIKRALEYGKKAEKSCCKLAKAKESILGYNALIKEQEGLSNTLSADEKLSDAYYEFLAWMNTKPKFKESDVEEIESYRRYRERYKDFYDYKLLKKLILKNLAQLHFQIQKYGDALRYLKNIGRSPDMLLLGGKCQYYLGDFDNALSIFENALYRYGYSKALYEGRIKNTDSPYAKLLYKVEMLMLPPYDETSPLIPEKVSYVEAAECLRWIALCHTKGGNTKKSLHCAELIKKLMLDNSIEGYRGNMLIAEIYDMNGEYDKANSFMQLANKECETREEKLNTVMLIAENKMKTSSYFEALANWKKAEEIASHLYSIRHTTNFKIAMNIGDCYLNLKNYELSQKYYEELREAFKDTDYDNILVTSKLAKIHALKRNMDLSEKMYDDAISSAIDLLGRSTIEVSNLYYEKAGLYMGFDDDKAIECLKNCLSIRKGLLHMEDGLIVRCQEELLKLYEKKHDREKARSFRGMIERAKSKIDFGMLVSFAAVIVLSIVYHSNFASSLFNPRVNPSNAMLLASFYLCGIAVFSVTFKMNIKKFTKGFSGTLIIFGITLTTLMMQSYFKTLASIESYWQLPNLVLVRIITIIKAFGFNASCSLLPLIILCWFIAYNGFLNHKPLKILVGLLLTVLYIPMLNPIILAVYFLVYAYLFRHNNYRKWMQPNTLELAATQTFFIVLFAFIALFALAKADITPENPVLQSFLNLFTLSYVPTMWDVRNYPPLILIIHLGRNLGILAGLLLAAVYFTFVALALKNAKRIKPGYLKTVYQTICFFFLMTGALNILYSIMDIILQTHVQKILQTRAVLFPFLSPNPLYLIGSFFFAGILFSFYYNRKKE
jgi:serine/threonine protein kinase